MQSYTNTNGVDFNIDTEQADVPENADYFGYLFKVYVASEGVDSYRIYKAMVKKTLCPTEQQARVWLNTTGLDFLKSILETYTNGRTLLLIPNSVNWWVV